MPSQHVLVGQKQENQKGKADDLKFLQEGVDKSAREWVTEQTVIKISVTFPWIMVGSCSNVGRGGS